MAVIQKEIEGLFAELAGLDPTSLTLGEVTDYAIRSQAIRSMADAQCARSAGAVETSGAWVGEGAQSPGAWISWRAGIRRAKASGSLVCARELRAMPATEVAFLAGKVSVDHVRLLAEAQAAAPGVFADGGEAQLLGSVPGLLFSQFERVIAYWCQLAAPDDAESKARRRYEQRRAHCSRTLAGTVILDAILDPITGEIVLRELERRERDLFDEDLAEARERLGPNPPLSELKRTPAQRRADALRVMAERSAAKAPGAVEPRVLLQVLAGHDTVERICELSNGTVITPGEILPVLDRAEVERIVFDGPSRIIDIGTRRRLFTGATRTAVQARDRRCVNPSCDIPAERCEVDHVQPYAAGGPTTQTNGACKCKYHHRRAPQAPRPP